MFWQHRNVESISSGLKNNQHSGATFGYCVRQMQRIAKEGFQSWNRIPVRIRKLNKKFFIVISNITTTTSTFQMKTAFIPLCLFTILAAATASRSETVWRVDISPIMWEKDGLEKRRRLLNIIILRLILGCENFQTTTTMY